MSEIDYLLMPEKKCMFFYDAKSLPPGYTIDDICKMASEKQPVPFLKSGIRPSFVVDSEESHSENGVDF